MYVVFTNPYNLYFKQKLEKLDHCNNKHVPRQQDKVLDDKVQLQIYYRQIIKAF